MNGNKPIKIQTWLNKHISKKDWGRRFDRPIHVNSKATLEEFYTHRRHWVRSITYKQYRQHWDNKDTLYYTGNEESGQMLVMVDVDCHRTGTREAAFAFASWFRSHHMPSLYYEDSTNGNGCHGYFVLKYGKRSPQEVCDLLKQIEDWLKSLSNGWDIEGIEIKGHPHVTKWIKPGLGYRFNGLKMGQLAKLPREMDTRAEELKATFSIDFETAQQTFVPTEVPVKSTGGSAGRKIFREERLAGLQPGGRYHRLGVALHKPETRGEEVITTADYSILLMLLEHCSQNGTSDGTMPTARLRELWRSLYEAGDISRAWSNRRFTAMRDELARWGWIEMVDNSHIIGTEDSEGRAMRWHGSEQMLDVVSSSSSTSVENTHTTFVVGTPYEESLIDGEYKPICIGFASSSDMFRISEPDISEIEAKTDAFIRPALSFTDQEIDEILDKAA